MARIAVTGIGPVSPIGIGRETFWSSLNNGLSGIGKSGRYSSQGDLYCGEIGGPPIADYMSDKRFRRAADVSHYALVAGTLAIQDAGHCAIDGSDTALVMGITHGALGFTQKFHRALIDEGVNAISPIHFSDSVLNAPAGNASICFGIKGPVHTLVGGQEVGIKAIALACEMLHSRRSAKALVVSAEELNELTLSCYARMGVAPLSEGAGALLFEVDDNIAAGRVPYCHISSTVSGCATSGPDAAAREVIAQCLEKAQLRWSDIDLIVTDQNMQQGVVSDDVARGGIIRLTGNAFSAATLWHIITASLAIRNNTIPETFIINKIQTPRNINNVMVCATGQYAASAIILSKMKA